MTVCVNGMRYVMSNATTDLNYVTDGNLPAEFLQNCNVSRNNFKFFLKFIFVVSETYRGRGVRGLDSLDRTFELPFARFLDVSLDLLPPLLLLGRSLKVNLEIRN